MSMFNFSEADMKVRDLTLDLARGEFSLHVDAEKVTRKDLEEYLRNTINNDYLKGATLYQAFRRNNITMFEIIEEIVDVTIGEDVLSSPFIESLRQRKTQ